MYSLLPHVQVLSPSVRSSLAWRTPATRRAAHYSQFGFNFFLILLFSYKHNKSERDRWQDLIHFYQMFLGYEYKTEDEGKEKEVWPLGAGRARLWRPVAWTVPSSLSLNHPGHPGHSAVSEEELRVEGLLPGRGTNPNVHEKAGHRSLTG